MTLATIPAAQGPMHPVSITSTWSERPFSTIASRRAEQISNAPDARQPPPMHTRTCCLACGFPVFGFLLFEVFPDLQEIEVFQPWLRDLQYSILIRVQDLTDSSRLDPLMDISVDHNGWSQTAGSETAGNFKREDFILGGLSHVNGQLLFNGVENLLSSTNIACCSKTDSYDVFSAGLC